MQKKGKTRHIVYTRWQHKSQTYGHDDNWWELTGNATTVCTELGCNTPGNIHRQHARHNKLFGMFRLQSCSIASSLWNITFLFWFDFLHRTKVGHWRHWEYSRRYQGKYVERIINKWIFLIQIFLIKWKKEWKRSCLSSRCILNKFTLYIQ